MEYSLRIGQYPAIIVISDDTPEITVQNILTELYGEIYDYEREQCSSSD